MLRPRNPRIAEPEIPDELYVSMMSYTHISNRWHVAKHIVAIRSDTNTKVHVFHHISLPDW